MFNRACRIFMVGLVAIVVAAIVCQVYLFHFQAGPIFVELGPHGLGMEHRAGPHPWRFIPLYVFSGVQTTVGGLWTLPRIGLSFDWVDWVVRLPWWWLVLTWGSVTFLAWRFRRHRKAGGMFPVEVNAKPHDG